MNGGPTAFEAVGNFTARARFDMRLMIIAFAFAIFLLAPFSASAQVQAWVPPSTAAPQTRPIPQVDRTQRIIGNTLAITGGIVAAVTYLPMLAIGVMALD